MKTAEKRFYDVQNNYQQLKRWCRKTTTTVNLAYSFMHLGKKILVVDADPQANATPFFLPRKTDRSIKDVYRNPAHVKRSIYRTRYGNIDIIPGSTELEEDDASQIDVIKRHWIPWQTDMIYALLIRGLPLSS